MESFFGTTRPVRVHKYTYIHGYFRLYFFPPPSPSDIRRIRIRGNRKLNRNAIISIHRPISHSDPIDLEKSTREFNTSGTRARTIFFTNSQSA